jgi:von Willebrand factor type A domain
MRRRRSIELFSLSFLDLITGALGALIILFVSLPKPSKVLGPETKIKPIMNPNETTELMLENKLLKNQVLHLSKLLDEQKNNLKTKEFISQTIAPQEASQNEWDLGFKFKGKNIIFVVDTSYSMKEENRMLQVQAGLKFFLSSLEKGYNVEIVQFPFGERAPFKSFWGRLQDFNSINRSDAYDFIYRMNPSGATPTRDALLFVLKNYDNLSDIVLLTDGFPTFHNSNKRDDIDDILRVIRLNNAHKVQINTIGVGRDVLSDQTSLQYKFLTNLASDNNGFFVGF